MIGTAIGMGVGLIGGLGSLLFGQKKASQAMKDARKNLNRQKAENEAWYKRRYNEDVTQSADVRRLLTEMGEGIKNRNRAAAGRAAVMGLSPEAEAAERARNTSVMSDTVSRVAAQGVQRKQGIENAYLTRKQNFDNQELNMDTQRANQITQAAGQAAGAFTKMGMGLAEGLEGTTFTKTRSADDTTPASTTPEEDQTKNKNNKYYEPY